MNKIKFDKRNYRKHSDKNLELIKRSLEECGTARSIVIDSENEIICGNGVFSQSKELNIPVKIIETDGKELIAIKRTDLKTNDDKRKQLAVMDNSTSDTSTFDMDLLQEDFSIEDLAHMGLDVNLQDIEIEPEDEDTANSDRFQIIIECTEEEKDNIQSILALNDIMYQIKEV